MIKVCKNHLCLALALLHMGSCLTFYDDITDNTGVPYLGSHKNSLKVRKLFQALLPLA